MNWRWVGHLGVAKGGRIHPMNTNWYVGHAVETTGWGIQSIDMN